MPFRQVHRVGNIVSIDLIILTLCRLQLRHLDWQAFTKDQEFQSPLWKHQISKCQGKPNVYWVCSNQCLHRYFI